MIIPSAFFAERSISLIIFSSISLLIKFNSRYQEINWMNYCDSDPFVHSSNALYYWAPIADELKKLDKKIVLNSMLLKWNNVQIDFKKLTIKFNSK